MFEIVFSARNVPIGFIMTSDDEEKSQEIPEGQARDSWGNQVV